MNLTVYKRAVIFEVTIARIVSHSRMLHITPVLADALDVGNMISGFGGAIAGALVAYWTERRMERNKKVEQDFGAFLVGQTALIIYMNDIGNLRRATSALKEDEERHLKLLTILSAPRTHSLDLASLSFLLHSREDVGLMMDLYLADRSYLTMLDCVAHRNKVREEIEATGQYGFSDKGTSVLISSPAKMETLLQSTNDLYESIDRAEKFLPQVFAKMRGVGKKLFPEKALLNLKPADTGETADMT
jgi:hypothetical protein